MRKSGFWKLSTQCTDVKLFLLCYCIQITTVIAAAAAAEAKEARQRQIIAGPWKLERVFCNQDGPGKLSHAMGIALSPDWSVAVADWHAEQIQIYSIGGEHKLSIDTTQGHLQSSQTSCPWQVTVNSENIYFFTDWTKNIKMYESSGKFKGQWVSSSPQASLGSPSLRGLAMDTTGNLLVGDCTNNYINRHRQDGSYLGSIKVGIEPRHIAVTSQDSMVIANWYKPPQIVSDTGQVMHTLKHPVDESQWDPRGFYCHEDIIFVASPIIPNILCYTESGKYLGPIPIPPVYPRGLAITADCKTLLVCELHSVKVFTSWATQKCNIFIPGCKLSMVIYTNSLS